MQKLWHNFCGITIFMYSSNVTAYKNLCLYFNEEERRTPFYSALKVSDAFARMTDVNLFGWMWRKHNK